MEVGKLRNETDLASVSMALPALPPAEPLNESDADAFFAAELNKLSMKERDDVLQDIHGVSDVMNENPEFVKRSTAGLLVELEKIPNESKMPYLLALEQNPNYVQDEKFLLMFLRADRFNEAAAAARLVSFFESKLELFGKDKLGRDILISDLTEEDRVCLESGYGQILSGRDRAGRAIFCLMPMCSSIKVIESKLRAIFMVFMFALQDVETQKRGIVGLVYNIGAGKSTDREAVWKAAKIVSILPVRFTGIHYCYDDEKIRLLFGLAMFVFNKNARIRCRLHFGTPMECIYTLMTFGIPSETLPVSASGDLRLEAHHEYISKMRKSEMARKRSCIILPGKYDVLLGRGKPLQKHNGNLNYHYVIEGFHSNYEQASKLEKTKLAKHIVEQIQGQGGRFLKQDETGCWVEIDDETARTKVSHTFRNHRIAARTALKKAAVAQEVCANVAPVPTDHRRRNFAFGATGMQLAQPAFDSKRRRVEDSRGIGDR
mmetsp:Transcript_19560/g.36480  ORF Transcript_19560/g.36480 Transcript_19560/m.36480 type:complete len:489 (+) Transcript_19560:119-1585(+)|eukprot:CAMPEP_0178858992 /NCGR_PEP_ID=MMETSP0747-20121128/962_1 /TAXON_ID=913974 /ORGANISM="Nitzschia punctata, Strain CCMP561" /LENGTH=488 /DNA_ID=CAMNT_0020525329 /DNA_START=24 /DNA_END=1490 /DNA_ORIENTATION=-